jgi:nitronate monooxygenase
MSGADWPDRRLCDLLGLVHPIIQAPMVGSATPELAAAVGAAGGLGSLGLGLGGADAVHAASAAMRARTNAGFNLNLFVMPALPAQNPADRAAMRAVLAAPYAALGPVPDPEAAVPPCGLDKAVLEALLEARPAVASFHFGLPDPAVMARLKAAGIRVLCSATTVAEARTLEAAGVDAVIAQGWEAGGHRGSHRPTLPGDGVGTLALVPQVVDAVRVPVIAAGGICDGRGIAAALMLGAAGVQMGTAFLTCPEAGTDAPRRALLARASDSDTMVTDAYSGRSARAVRSRLAEDLAPLAGRLAPYPEMYAFSGPLEAADGNAAASFHLYGQAAALCRTLPAADLVGVLARDALALLERRGRR